MRPGPWPWRVISNPLAEDSSPPQSGRLFTYHLCSEDLSLSAHVEDLASSHTTPAGSPPPPGSAGLGRGGGGGQCAHESVSTDLAAACRQFSPAPAPALAPGGPAILCPRLTALPPGPLGPPHRTRRHQGSQGRGPTLPLKGGAHRGAHKGEQSSWEARRSHGLGAGGHKVGA